MNFRIPFPGKSGPAHQPPMSTPGSSPGSLIHIGERRSENVTFEVHTYNPGTCTCERIATPAELSHPAAESGETTWIHVEGLHEVEDIAALGERFAIDALTLEDILNTRSRPKIEISPTGIFVVAEMLCRIPESNKFDIQRAAFLVLPGNVLLSFLEGPSEVFTPVRQRLETGSGGRIRKLGADYLLWALLDAVTDHYLHSLWAVEEAISALEDKLQEGSESVPAQDLFTAKKESTRLYHLVRPMVEIATTLTRSDSPILGKKSRNYFQDLFDHAIQAKDTADSARDQTSALRDFHLAMVSHRMNEVMKVLTCFASIFLPLTFLAGIYGMNFEYIPELRWRWAYPALWGIFAVLIIGMLWYFRRKKWL